MDMERTYVALPYPVPDIVVHSLPVKSSYYCELL